MTAPPRTTCPLRFAVRLVWLCALALAGGCAGGSPPGPISDAGVEPAPASWQVVFDGDPLDRAVLSVWAAAPDRVFFVGGGLGRPGLLTLVLRFDGTRFEAMSPGGDETLWWVAGTSAQDVWMVGERGRILHFDGARFEEHSSGVDATLWGVWPASPDDVWVVGGTPGGGAGAPTDVVLRYDGNVWSPVTLPGAPLGVAHFKVWGVSSDDLYIVGERGTIWHRSAAGWSQPERPEGLTTLLTVAGCSASEVYAVGNSAVLRSEGAGGPFEAVDVSLSGPVNGVTCVAPGAPALVGFGGLKLRRVQGEWLDELDQRPYGDMHAVATAGTDPTRPDLWAVGGDFAAVGGRGPRDGLIARLSASPTPTLIAP